MLYVVQQTNLIASARQALFLFVVGLVAIRAMLASCSQFFSVHVLYQLLGGFVNCVDFIGRHCVLLSLGFRYTYYTILLRGSHYIHNWGRQIHRPRP